MINQTGFVGISGTVTTSVGAKEADPDLIFEGLLTEKTSSAEESLRVLIAEKLGAADNDALVAEAMEQIMKAVASMHEGEKDIWEIVLRLEKHVEPKLLDEIVNMNFDDAAGLNGIAGLLAMYWKKKELLEESDTVFSHSYEHNSIDDKAASELADLLKKKEHRLITEVHESATDA